MEIKDYLTEIILLESLKHCYYDDPKQPEVSKQINEILQNKRKEMELKYEST